ncbi:hypothetical protein TWF506_006009 [Arthrobotrys conoides]|uniref:Uncharacterized protein n=1 Tax=Arthrobotrys conoides TaxID=74498 RepID=A0AAN8NQ76_9PEZI
MRSNLLLFTAIGFSTMAVARYLPEPVKDNGQKHLVKRQMENNPFSPKPIITIPQIPNIRITNDDEGEGREGEGGGTPRFSDTSDEGVLEPPSFRGVGLTHALDNVQLEDLENGPNAMSQSEYAELKRLEEEAEEPQRSPNLNVEPKSGEPEYEYASFIFEDDDDEVPVENSKPVCSTGGNRLIGPSPPPAFALQRRPDDLPKYNKHGVRMGFILNEGRFTNHGTEDVPPYWGPIQPGHIVAEEPEYLDDTDPVSPVSDPECLSGLGGVNNPGRQSVQSEDEEFFDVEEPTEEQERIIREDLQAQLQALANQDGAPAREADELDEFVADVDNLNDVEDEGSVSTGHKPGVGETPEDLVDFQLEDVEELFTGPTDPEAVDELLVNPLINTDAVQELIANPQINTEATDELPVNPQANTEATDELLFNPQINPEVSQELLVNPPTNTEASQEALPKTRPGINLATIANLDQSYFPRGASRPRRQGNAPVQVVREEEEEKSDPETLRVQARLKELYGIEPKKDARKERSKSPIRKFGEFVVSIPRKGVEAVYNKVTGRRRRNPAAKFESVQNEPPTIIQPNNIEDVIQPPAVIEGLDADNQPIILPVHKSADLEISTSGWNKPKTAGKDIYDVPGDIFGNIDMSQSLDEEEIMKSYYKRRLRK